MKPHDKLVAGLALCVAAPPILMSWWYSSQAKEPPFVLYFLLPSALLFSAVALAWAWRRSKVGLLTAPLALVATCAVGTSISSRVGERQVLAFCKQLLEAPQSAESHVGELTALSAVSNPQCRIIDFSWGGMWELGVYSEGQRIGSIDLLRRESSFVISNARRS